ncbi:hypothetical protein [Cellulosimicrobium funkei]|uniref:Uncharacterized protein n=1 Tax=Cellulosimicrobium funkei TaxID=264251 RepID=A0A4Y8QX27_9MICO|nr:hypothetical protein [Cellulosimicrobium funkei]TFF03725.1 hypothetical protein E1O70_19450 [Cellulosimicrobium funkei]TGA67363.1 hypothetical protein EQW79_019245 [Cellulosimicrobium terreum]
MTDVIDFPPRYNPFKLPLRRDDEGNVVVYLPYTTTTAPFDCGRCGTEFNNGCTVITEPKNLSMYVCRTCANDDPQLRVWQQFADIANQVDRLFEPVGDVQQRQILLNIIASHTSWMANWRWEEDEPISIQQPRGEFDDEDELDPFNAS